MADVGFAGTRHCFRMRMAQIVAAAVGDDAVAGVVVVVVAVAGGDDDGSIDVAVD